MARHGDFSDSPFAGGPAAVGIGTQQSAGEFWSLPSNTKTAQGMAFFFPMSHNSLRGVALRPSHVLSWKAAGRPYGFAVVDYKYTVFALATFLFRREKKKK